MVGILKAYTTRVGSGPFPTELFDANGEYLRKQGGEVGVTTGRDRRCGWFDAVVARYASRVNGITDYFLTKLDVLSGLETVPICVAYDVDGVRHDEMPMTQTEFHHATPVYEEMPGWFEDIRACRTLRRSCRPNAQAYVRRLEELSGARISVIGVGPGRDENVVVARLDLTDPRRCQGVCAPCMAVQDRSVSGGQHPQSGLRSGRARRPARRVARTARSGESVITPSTPRCEQQPGLGLARRRGRSGRCRGAGGWAGTRSRRAASSG